MRCVMARVRVNAKEWQYHTTSLTLDFATQGMSTKPYAVTRGEIRPSLTHENMGGDPYAEVRFMVSAETPVGAGRMRVMGYSGMAMGYALGLHADGDAMMPSYLLTNRDAFHAPYLALASSGLGGGMLYRLGDGSHIGFVVGEGTSLNADGSLPYQQQTRRPRAFCGHAGICTASQPDAPCGCIARKQHVVSITGVRLV